MSRIEQSRTRVRLADPDVSERARERVARALGTGRLASGEEVEGFEEAFAEYCDVDHAVATANGTVALHAAIVACDVGDGDTVVTTPFSFVATANAVRFAGAEPVFADVDPRTLNLDPDAVRAAIEARDGDVDAILPVHLYGLPAEMDAFRAIADEYGATLIEDAAQAHGARYGGDPVGGFGAAATFSFYPTKNMTTGEGGMIVTDSDAVAAAARRFVNHGRAGPDTHVTLGHNFRMTDLAGAIGRVQLQRLPAFVRRRRENARRIAAAVGDGPLTAPPDPDGRRHAYHQFTVRTDRRDALEAHLDERGIDTGVYYPTPIHRQPAYDHVSAEAPVAERAAESVLSVPVHPGLSDGDVEAVADALASFDP